MIKKEEMKDLLIWMTGGVTFTPEQGALFREILALIEGMDKGPKLSLHADGWWIHFSGKWGKVADLYLGANHGPIVESVLLDNVKADMRVKEKGGWR